MILNLIALLMVSSSVGQIDNERSLDSNSSHSLNLMPERFEPFKMDTNGTGTIIITAYPKETDIYVNGKYIGNGKKIIEYLKPGFYTIDAAYQSRKYHSYVLVEQNRLSIQEIKLARKCKFVFEPSLNQLYFKDKLSYGPSLDLGLQVENNYYGIDYNCNLFNSSLLFAGGSLFKWLHSFSYVNSYSNVASISPGANIGIWYCDMYKPNSSSEHDVSVFFGALTVKSSIGYRSVFFKFEHSIFIGTSYANMFRIGFSFKL
jgi:hypothetical protein